MRNGMVITSEARKAGEGGDLGIPNIGMGDVVAVQSM